MCATQLWIEVSPDGLLQLAKGSMHAVVGPLLKKEFVGALNSFKTWEAFPDVKSNAFGFDTDPDDPMRVWFFYKTSGTMQNDWSMGGTQLKATGKPIRNGVEAASYIWTPDRKIKCALLSSSTTPVVRNYEKKVEHCLSASALLSLTFCFAKCTIALHASKVHAHAPCATRTGFATFTYADSRSGTSPALRRFVMCRYMSVGYCVDRINSSTPNGSMDVAVAGLLRAADAETIWKAISNPTFNWVQDVFRKLTGKPPRGTPWEDLPEWFKEIPDSKLKGYEGYK